MYKAAVIDTLSIDGLISYLLKSMAKLLLMAMLSSAVQIIKETTLICVPNCETAFRFRVRNFTA